MNLQTITFAAYILKMKFFSFRSEQYAYLDHIFVNQNTQNLSCYKTLQYKQSDLLINY